MLDARADRGRDRDTVMDVIKKLAENGKTANSGKDFKPQLYNIWNFMKITNETQHPGGSTLPDHNTNGIVLI